MGVVTSSTAMFVGVKWISGLKAEDKLRRNSPDLKKAKKKKAECCNSCQVCAVKLS